MDKVYSQYKLIKMITKYIYFDLNVYEKFSKKIMKTCL